MSYVQDILTETAYAKGYFDGIGTGEADNPYGADCYRCEYERGYAAGIERYMKVVHGVAA